MKPVGFPIACFPSFCLYRPGQHQLCPARFEAYFQEADKLLREQGVIIDRIHFEVILTQMLQVVEITDPDDTTFLAGEWVRRRALREANQTIGARGKQPASGRTVLLGADKATQWAVRTGEGFLSTGGRSQHLLPRLALCGVKDRLRGLEANVLLGKRIPAGAEHR